ncbi:hypothetical protein CHUV0807_0276 [Cardiobacterium hominis]|uniref:Uncharacterized protein n=1 Tax=Cardiobacterium hominis TaxID=2718 RepID=A0A1C3H223_9GAMM|nr:hypothetical protein CHUV0807_0276 [Cardiobacterium hominis]
MLTPACANNQNIQHVILSVKSILHRIPPPLQGEARSGRVPMQNASAFCMGPGGGLGWG